MALADLLCKLDICGAIKKRDNCRELCFTPKFTTHIIRYACMNRDKITAVQGWRAMLAGFHTSLTWLSDEELVTLVTLLEFQTRATRLKQLKRATIQIRYSFSDKKQCNNVHLMTDIHGQETRATDAKNTAIRELELMHQAIQDNELKKAQFHKKLANVAIDEMMLTSNMVGGKDKK